jgi:hypothetical protein
MEPVDQDFESPEGNEMGQISGRVFWDGKEVGVASNVKVDNFDYYGHWTPCPDAGVYMEFRNAVCDDEGASVVIGTTKPPLRGTVHSVPTDQIEIKIRC